jgi:hypothetical protein
MRKLIAIIILVAQMSCNQYTVQPLDDVDKIQIRGRTNGTVYNITDTESLNVFKEILDGKSKLDTYKANVINCDVEGWIWFMRGDAVKEIGSFSNSMPDCLVLIFNEGEVGLYRTYKLTKRSAIYLNTVMKKNINVGDNQH